MQIELQQDLKTGETPRKRDFLVPECWDRTKPREELIQDLYSNSTGDVGGMVGMGDSETPRRTRLPFLHRKL
jgi:hypothetical protein